MWRWERLAFALLGTGCRAVVGIDDLSYSPGDGGPDNGVALCARRFDCAECCKTQFPSLAPTFARGPGKRCVCDPSVPESCGGATRPCAADCLSVDAVLGGAADAAAKNECVGCVDQGLQSSSATPIGACATNTCKGDPACENGLACMRSCPHH